MKEFNVNHKVLVKLTKVGLDELEKQHNQLKETFPKMKDFSPPKTDKDGFSEWQLWHLMKELGHLCQLARNPPFETEIKIDL